MNLMRILFASSLGLLLGASACGKKLSPADADSTHSGAPSVKDSPTAGTSAARPPASVGSSSPSTAAPNGGPVTTDFKPFSAFREYAAKKLNVAPDKIEGGAVALDMARRMPNTIGDALAYEMGLKSEPWKDVRGWAMLDGTVVTTEQNLGRLFVEAGVWNKTPTLSADKLAEHLVWTYRAYGMRANVIIRPSRGFAAPSYEVAANGTGTFVFFLSWSPPGPGGAGGGPENVDEIRVVLSADHQAKLTRTPK